MKFIYPMSADITRRVEARRRFETTMSNIKVTPTRVKLREETFDSDMLFTDPETGKPHQVRRRLYTFTFYLSETDSERLLSTMCDNRWRLARRLNRSTTLMLVDDPLGHYSDAMLDAADIAAPAADTPTLSSEQLEALKSALTLTPAELDSERQSIVIYMPVALSPDERIDRYERPIDEVLKRQGWGNVDGGGSWLVGEGSSDIWIFTDDIEPILEPLRAILIALDCPTGTQVQYERGGSSLFDELNGALWKCGLSLDGADHGRALQTA